MGGSIALRLLDRGYRVVVRDIVPARVDALVAAGGIAADSAAAVARQADCVLTVVVDAAQTDQALFGDGGVVTAGPAATTDLTVVMCSTVGPGYARELGSRLASHRIALIDAPISGGPARARDGTLSMMIGGEDAVLARVAGVLEAIASRRFRVGSNAGDGSAMKIVNNMLAGVNLAAAGEALALAERLGMDLATVRSVVEASSGGSWIFADRVARLIDRDYVPPHAAARILMKDIGLAVNEAEAAGVPSPLARAAHRAFAGTVEQGFGDADDSAVIEHYRALIRANRPQVHEQEKT